MRNPIHGKSLLPLLRGETDKLREAALYGVFGKTVNVTDGRYTYLKKPVTDALSQSSASHHLRVGDGAFKQIHRS